MGLRLGGSSLTARVQIARVDEEGVLGLDVLSQYGGLWDWGRGRLILGKCPAEAPSREKEGEPGGLWEVVAAPVPEGVVAPVQGEDADAAQGDSPALLVIGLSNEELGKLQSDDPD